LWALYDEVIRAAKGDGKATEGTGGTGVSVGASAGAPNPNDDDKNKKPKKGVGNKGWRGDKQWRQDVKTVKDGGTIKDLRGNTPTQQEAVDLINEAGGKVNRIEGSHKAPNPHTYPHINYTTPGGGKGTIKIK